MSVPLLAVEDVSLSFARTHVLESVSITITAGESLGLVGESGSGKSVLARTLLGAPSAAAAPTVTGSIRFRGTELVGLAQKERRRAVGTGMSMIFQDPSSSLNPVVRVGQQVVEGATVRGRAARRELAVGLLRSVGIPDPELRARSYPPELSGGQRQRVGIAAALAGGPQLLLADEPTTALDVTVQREVLDLVDRLRRERDMALLLITHDLGVLTGRTDRVAVMYAGRIVECGPTAEVLTAPRHPYTRALLAATPRVSVPRRPPLPQIPGSLPDLSRPRVGCPFAPRCQHATSLCGSRPVLTTVGAHHRVACWAEAA